MSKSVSMSRHHVQTLAPVLPFQLYFRVTFLSLRSATLVSTPSFSNAHLDVYPTTLPTKSQSLSF